MKVSLLRIRKDLMLIYEIVFLYYQAIYRFVLTKLKRMLEKDHEVRITSNDLMIELDKLVDDLHLGKFLFFKFFLPKLLNLFTKQ